MAFHLRLLLFFVIITVAYGASPRKLPPSRLNANKYTTRYDYIDVDTILKSKRLLKNYMDCVLERGPCTREGLELRRNVPEALETECLKCSEKQKVNAGKIMGYLQQYEKKYWNELLARYDPKGTYRKRYEIEDFGEEVEDGQDYFDNTENES